MKRSVFGCWKRVKKEASGSSPGEKPDGLFPESTQESPVQGGALRGVRRLLILFAAGVLLLLGALAGLYRWGLEAPGGGKTVVLTVPRGASTGWVAEKLYQDGIIRSPLTFRLYARMHNLDKRIVHGTFRLTSDLSVPEVLKFLTGSGRVVKRFTIPEGLTLREIASRLEEQGIVNREEFLREAATGQFDYAFLKEVPPGPNRLEGYLFPDTYRVFAGVSARAVIELMLRRFGEVAGEINLAGKAAEQGLTVHEAVTLASLVEREAKREEERALIAGVLLNRLRCGMLLQVDATVQYALGEHRERILYRDLEVDSPYNTYRITGLPPGPIAAPGRASLLAVLHPRETDYLYYVAKPDGSHAFARTLEEHSANKRRYQGNP